MCKTIIITAAMLCLGLSISPSLLAEIDLNPPVGQTQPAAQPSPPEKSDEKPIPENHTPKPAETPANGVTPPPTSAAPIPLPTPADTETANDPREKIKMPW